MYKTDENYLDDLDREQLKLASFSKRLSAFIIDDILIGIIVIIMFWNIITTQENIEHIINAINQNLLYILVVKFAYHAFFIWCYGATLGKMAVKIRAIDINTFDDPNPAQSIIRSLTRLLSEFILFLGFLLFFISSIRQTLHDKSSKIIIVEQF